MSTSMQNLMYITDNPLTGDAQGQYIGVVIVVMAVALAVVIIIAALSAKKKK